MDSLLVGGFEMLGAVTNPEYRLSRGGFGLGDPEPDTATISSLLLDGDQVTGVRTKNRQVTLAVNVTSPVTVTRSDLTAKIDTLRQAVNAESFTVQWTPAGGLPVMFDCYRATVTRTRSILQDNQLWAQLTLTFQALPFGRSPVAQTIAGATSLQVDSFDTAPTGATLDTTTKFEGTGSAKFTPASLGNFQYSNAAAPVSRAFTAKDLSTYPTVSLRVLLGFSFGANLQTVLTLSSASGSSTFQTFMGPTQTGWMLPTFNLSNPVATTGGGVDLTAVTGYSLTTSLVGAHPTTGLIHVDDLRAVNTTALISTTAGQVLLMPAVIGSARTPVSLAATATSIDAVLLHSPPADQDVNAGILVGVTVSAAPFEASGITIPAAECGYRGTFSLLLGTSATPSGTNTVTVTVAQFENGVQVASKALTVTYTAPLLTGPVIPVGDITLPLRATATDNAQTTYTLDINHTAGSDAYTDVMFCDVRGQTVIAVPPASAEAVYVDAPTVGQGVGPIMASAAVDRTQAYGIFDGVLAVGGPILFEPGTNKLMTWCRSAALTVAATYYPRWLDERVA